MRNLLPNIRRLVAYVNLSDITSKYDEELTR